MLRLDARLATRFGRKPLPYRDLCWAISIVAVVRAGLIKPGRTGSGSVETLDGEFGELPITVRIYAEIEDRAEGLLTLRSESVERDIRVRVESRPCGFRRLWYFECPGLDPGTAKGCGKNALVSRLYVPKEGDAYASWACRTCYRVQYRSADRLYSRRAQLRDIELSEAMAKKLLVECRQYRATLAREKELEQYRRSQEALA
jgi:hypothetical protein